MDKAAFTEGFPGGSVVRIHLTMQETQVRPLGWEDPLEKEMAALLQYSCLEKSHGQKSLVGYTP